MFHIINEMTTPVEESASTPAPVDSESRDVSKESEESKESKQTRQKEVPKTKESILLSSRHQFILAKHVIQLLKDVDRLAKLVYNDAKARNMI